MQAVVIISAWTCEKLGLLIVLSLLAVIIAYPVPTEVCMRWPTAEILSQWFMTIANILSSEIYAADY